MNKYEVIYRTSERDSDGDEIEADGFMKLDRETDVKFYIKRKDVPWYENSMEIVASYPESVVIRIKKISQ